MDDFLTSEAIASSPELKLTRIETINELITNNEGVTITNLMGFLRYLPSKKVFKQNIKTLKVNQQIDPKILREFLFDIGYKKELIVSKTGDYAVRGFVIDIFPVSNDNPVRIEFWGDEIESIKEFDLDSQRTTKTLEEIDVIPNTEKLISEELPHRNLPDYIETVNLAGYMNNPIVVYDDFDQIKTSYEMLSEEIFNYNISVGLQGDVKYMFNMNEIPLCDEVIFNDFNNKFNNFKLIEYKTSSIEPFKGSIDDINARLNNLPFKNKKVIIAISTSDKASKIAKVLLNDNLVISSNYIQNKINIMKLPISDGFVFEDFIFISEKELFNRDVTQNKYKSKFKMGSKITDLNKIEKGDYVIHAIHGIGVYEGLRTLEKMGISKDYLTISYKNGDKLYIPVEKMDIISKYSSKEGAAPKINKLGSAEWQKTKLRVRARAESIAAELLKLYSERENSVGYAFDKDDEDQIMFESEFPYSETKDQLRVVSEIKSDMEKTTPMERLLCGDVGFGKTEVAFRAMFKAVKSGKQVAFLCPTTILSQQHYKNAIKRFSSHPINIEIINRFVTPNKSKHIINRLKEGKIDIIFGTHRLLSSDVEYKDLGLLVVDEEQRFGVKHKEKLKEYKNNIDILTLSATPIPRTLQMSMSGLRSLSLIETPPTNRYPVQTYVLKENNQIIKDAIYKEISRRGQVFILYNRIEDMEEKAVKFEKLVPEAKIGFAHGQMTKKEIEDVMMKFYNKEYDVLLSTTIIETGIDVPNANTLIILNADRFGLSQLYQLRGRVGRSDKIAYCYLMYEEGKVLTDIATKRLNVIKDFTELGSGFSIAARDLSLRGAGDILGKEQAGFVESIGIEMFMRMVKEEVAKLKGEYVPDEDINEDKPLLDIETSISDSYIEDEDLKIMIHKQISAINTLEEIALVKEDLEDKYGKLPDSIIVYMYDELFEKKANKLGIKNIRQTKNSVEILIEKDLADKLDGKNLFFDVARLSRMFRFGMKYNKLQIILDTIKLDKHYIYYLVELLNLLEKNMKQE